MKKPVKKPMNTETFLKKLARVKKRGWWVRAGGEIRCSAGWCPIMALWPRRGRFAGNNDVYDVAAALGIPTRLTNRIVEAADSFDPWDAPASDPLRRKMKAILGLG